MRTIWIIPGMFGLNVGVTFGLTKSGSETAPESFVVKATTKAWKIVTEMQARHYQRRQLKALPNYLLQDLGLSREEALTECQKPFWR